MSQLFASGGQSIRVSASTSVLPIQIYDTGTGKTRHMQWKQWGRAMHVCVCTHACVRIQRVLLFVTPWTVACQAPLSMYFSRQEYWSGLPFSLPGHLPNPGIELTFLLSPALAGGFFTNCAPWEIPELCTVQSVSQFSPSVMSNSLRRHETQHAWPPCPSPTAGVYSNSCPLSW